MKLTPRKLGEILVNSGKISNQQLDKAISYQNKHEVKLGEAIIALNYLNEFELLKVLSGQLDIQYVDLRSADINSDMVTILPENIARKHKACVLNHHQGCYIVGLVDPLDIEGYDEVLSYINAPIKLVLTDENQLLQYFDRYYTNSNNLELIASKISDEANQYNYSPIAHTVEADDASEPIINLLNSILDSAIKSQASDIHIEPSNSKLRIRMRVDGILNETLIDDSKVATTLVRVIKLKARMNLEQSNQPQDGRFTISIYERLVDVRVSTMPLISGESIVLRLLDRSRQIHDLSSLGMPSLIVETLSNLLFTQNGMILVTGPTGSGKTTTLYSLLSRINSIKRKVITVEDPVEYTIDNINQVQINPTNDLSFSNVLRSVLRQDPDVIMVGEIRDRQTAKIAMRAAITGHLVLSSLHTSDALTSIIRLADIGQEGYMVASAIKAIVSQRLVQLNCQNCISEQQLRPTQREWLNHNTPIQEHNYSNIRHSSGCALCHYNGYNGRTALFELLLLNEKMINTLCNDSLSDFLIEVSNISTYETLLEHAYSQLCSGNIPLSEVIKLHHELGRKDRV